VLRRAARELRLHPVTLSRRMKRLGIDPESGVLQK
jgi:transcriptional regulator with GAF, ATPase, and Fis domain